MNGLKKTTAQRRSPLATERTFVGEERGRLRARNKFVIVIIALIALPTFFLLVHVVRSITNWPCGVGCLYGASHPTSLPA